MRKFVVKIEFSADDMSANSMFAHIVEAVEDAVPINPYDLRFVMIPDAEISDADIKAEADFDYWVNMLIHKFDQKLRNLDS